MKNFKYMSLMMAFACVLSLGFSSCGSDDDDDNSAPAPTIVMVVGALKYRRKKCQYYQGEKQSFFHEARLIKVQN